MRQDLPLRRTLLLKARYTCEATGLPAIADDSGLCVDALNGDPGIFQRGGLVYTEMIEPMFKRFCNGFADVPDEKRTAHFMCSLIGNARWPSSGCRGTV
jgi:XTP/dITP diphosphohydrolase